MPDWWIEHGIGETRAALIEDGQIIEARVLLDGVIPEGSILSCRLRSVGRDGRNALARADDGTEILLPRRPAGISEGSTVTVEITREAIPGNEPWKRPVGRVTDGSAGQATLEGRDLIFPPIGRDALQEAGWSDLIEEARSGVIPFEGGELRLHATPAMTLIDVDGHLPPSELAVAGALAAGAAIRRLGIGGSIGIDLPTLAGKEKRQAAALAVDKALEGTAFERTAVNGFGFLQIVRPRRHASLLELASDRVRFEARALLRQAALAHGSCTLAIHPLVAAILEAKSEWIRMLERQRGGPVTLRADPKLAISASHVEPS